VIGDGVVEQGERRHFVSPLDSRRRGIFTVARRPPCSSIPGRATGRRILRIEASCHCRAVRFSVEAYAPAPYLRCYCSICRKTAGGGGYAINLGARAKTLTVTGSKHIRMFRATIDGDESPAERRFCGRCGSALWVQDPRWPDLVHPFASAIDTPLPKPPEQVHMMLGSKADWVRVDARRGEERHDAYPDASLRDWHRAHGLLSKP
jgi:hypothetical protein